MIVSGTLVPLQEGILPTYAHDMLWLKPERGNPIQIANDGTFEITPALKMELCWGHPEGAVLTSWRQPPIPPYVLEWDGIIRLGGFVERIHVFELDELPLMIVELVGGAYPHVKPELPSLEQLKQGAFSRVEEHDPSHDRHWYSLLLPLDSPFADFMHHTLVHGTAVDCTAVLGEEEGGWHEIVGLPLLLESVTLLAGGL
jgi:hypothetical protein